MKTTRRRMDVNLEELDRVLDGARQSPLSEKDHDKLKDTLHALVAMLVRSRNSEKTSDVLPKPEAPPTPEANEPQKPGHGRLGSVASRWKSTRLNSSHPRLSRMPSSA